MVTLSEVENTYFQPVFDVSLPPQSADRAFSSDLQHTIFQADVAQGTEDAEMLVRIEGCQVINQPIVRQWEEKKQKKKEWRCTFVAPPDLWNQERSVWI